MGYNLLIDEDDEMFLASINGWDSLVRVVSAPRFPVDYPVTAELVITGTTEEIRELRDELRNLSSDVSIEDDVKEIVDTIAAAAMKSKYSLTVVM